MRYMYLQYYVLVSRHLSNIKGVSYENTLYLIL